MRPILEYIISKSSKRYTIKATDDTIHQIVKDELDRLGHDADLNHIDVSEVTDMNHLFSCSNNPNLGIKYNDLNPDISRWNVSKVKDMSYMFHNCVNFNCNISNWNVSKVENMRGIFDNCENFNQDISRWNIQNVKYYALMFYNCHIKEEYKPKI